MSDDSDEIDDYVCPEDLAYCAECTCDHEPEQHGWLSCEVEGCACEGHWEY